MQFVRMQKFQVQRLQICQQTTSIAFAYPLIKEQDEREIYNQKMKWNFKNQNMIKESRNKLFENIKRIAVGSLLYCQVFVIASVGCVRNNAIKAGNCLQ